MPTNPLANRKFARPPAKPRGGPTLEQINNILKAASDVRRTVIAMAAFAGLGSARSPGCESRTSTLTATGFVSFPDQASRLSRATPGRCRCIRDFA